MTDKGLHFGIQNFFCVAQDETDGTYNYYCYLDRKGCILIMRTNKTDTEIRYYSTTGVYATVWAAKATYTYVLPTQLEDVTI